MGAMATTIEPRSFVRTPAELGHRTRTRGQWAIAWNQLKRSRNAMVGGTVAVFLVVIAVLSPWITPYDPIETVPKDRLQGPSWAHLFGTDKLGRDIFSRVIGGAPNSLKMGLIAIVIGATVGTFFGLIAGYYRG